jgi:3D-(3,5/4)-trihydroxycyclohexane-1,2-dione acylhydrolase (decyclizing)
MALGMVNRIIAPDSVVIGASGSLPGCMQRMWRPSVPNTYNMEYGYSCMGYEVSGALGVKLAIGEKREVYAMTGDGSFNMLHSELITSVQEGKKINVVLFDNASFGCINNLQMGTGNDTMCTEMRMRKEADRLHHKGSFMHIDYAAIAKAYGCVSYTVRTAEELEAALEDSKKQKVSTLIDIKVLPKSMTEGYGGWWRVGVAEVSERESIQSARKTLEEHLQEARRY